MISMIGGGAFILEAEGGICLEGTDVRRVIARGEAVSIGTEETVYGGIKSVIGRLLFAEKARVQGSEVEEIFLLPTTDRSPVLLELENAVIKNKVVLSCNTRPCKVVLDQKSIIQCDMNLSFSKKSEVYLQGGSRVVGNVIFLGSRGTVFLEEGSEIVGEVVNGVVKHINK